MIGCGAAVLILYNGRIAGISGILDRALHGAFGPQGWRIAFLAGLLIPALVLGPGDPIFNSNVWTLAGAGLWVGYGTRTGSGCTSGHGVCGIANFSLRSLIATLTFMLVAMATVFCVRHLALP